MWDIDRAKEFFRGDQYAVATSGIRIDDITENAVRCSMPIDRRHENAVHHVMGGAIYTLADFVFAVATNTEQQVTVTTTSQISYLGTPKGKILYGESKILKDGRRECFYQIDITDDLGNAVAVVTTTGTHLS